MESYGPSIYKGRIAGTHIGTQAPENDTRMLRRMEEEQKAIRDKPWNDKLDNVQMGLNVVGFLPGIGSFADLANTGISLARGDLAGAAMNAIFAIPGLGDVFQAGNMAKKGIQKASSFLP